MEHSFVVLHSSSECLGISSSLHLGEEVHYWNLEGPIRQQGQDGTTTQRYQTAYLTYLSLELSKSQTPMKMTEQQVITMFVATALHLQCFICLSYFRGIFLHALHRLHTNIIDFQGM